MQPDNHKLFLKLILEHQPKIYSYILSLVPSYHDADDILQNSFEVMWRRFDQFEPGTNFLSWALRCAYYEILTFRKKKARSKEVVYDNELFEQILPVLENELNNSDRRQDALEDCIDRLNDSQKEVIKFKYNMNLSAKEIGSKLECKENSVYKLLSRLHRTLFECIEGKLGLGLNTNE